MQKQIPNFSLPVQFYWITPFCSKYFVQDCSNLSNTELEEFDMEMFYS